MRTKPPTPEALELGQKIKRARLRRKLTGEDIRTQAGIHPTSLSFIERGLQEPSPEQMRALANVLGVTFRFAPSSSHA